MMNVDILFHHLFAPPQGGGMGPGMNCANLVSSLVSSKDLPRLARRTLNY
jgi:hypothetical protein